MTSIPYVAANAPTENEPDRIEILDMCRLNGRGAVKGTCRVRIDQVVIGGYKIICPALASRPFVSPPSRKIGDDWEKLVSVLSPTLEQAINDAVLRSWRGAQ